MVAPIVNARPAERRVFREEIREKLIDDIISGRLAPEPSHVYDEVAYTIAVANRGPASAPAAAVDATLDEGVDLVSATSSSATCTALAGEVQCRLRALRPRAAATIAVVLRPTRPGALRARAAVTLPTRVRDPKRSNNANFTWLLVTRSRLVNSLATSPSSRLISSGR